MLPVVEVSAYITHCYLGETKWDLGGETGGEHLMFIIKKLAKQGSLEMQVMTRLRSAFRDLNASTVTGIWRQCGGDIEY